MTRRMRLLAEWLSDAASAARTTCQAPAVLGACRALAVALEAALRCEPKAAILERARTALGAAAHPDPSGAQPASTAPAVRSARGCALHCRHNPSFLAQQPDQKAIDRKHRPPPPRARAARRPRLSAASPKRDFLPVDRQRFFVQNRCCAPQTPC